MKQAWFMISYSPIKLACPYRHANARGFTIAQLTVNKAFGCYLCLGLVASFDLLILAQAAAVLQKCICCERANRALQKL